MKTVGSNSCENCLATHSGEYGSGRFCSSICARGFSTKNKRKEINEKVSERLTGIPTGRTITDTQRSVMRAAQIDFYESIPFSDLGKTGKKKRILQDQKNACDECGITEWRGHPITLELEHIDGNSSNDDRSNLKCICPNCHSLTATWRGRNKGNGKRITDDEFILALSQSGSVHKGLLSLGLAPKGGNYKRARRLIFENNLPITLPPVQT